MGREQMGESSSAEHEIVHEVPAGEIYRENLVVDTNGEKVTRKSLQETLQFISIAFYDTII